MDNIYSDKRFNHVSSNPRFKKVPRNERKVQIDKRFQSMFTDKRFQVKYTVDERGRKIDELQTDNYKKYYDLNDSDENDSSPKESELSASDSSDDENDSIAPAEGKTDPSEDRTDSPEEGSANEDKVLDEHQLEEREKSKQKIIEAHKEVNKFIDELHKDKINEKVREKLADITVDYARGYGNLLSGSESSSDESSSEESDGEEIEHPWGELDGDAERTDEITSRLAICNMDWDRVTAKDLMVLFHSFLPPGGGIESVTIYPSEFGLQRMAEEELKGPKELVESNSAHFEVTSDDEIEEGSEYQREKLREYQLKRLKYYYAIVVCNTPEVANVLYTECDGIEYESSATKLDLRFVPDGETFDQKPKDVCRALPDLKKYKPRLFINSALQQGKVELTWDETDPERVDLGRKLLAGEEIPDDQLKAYIATSSGDDLSQDEEENEEAGKEDKGEVKTEDERIQKYRELIANLQDSKEKKRGDVEMEVSWGVDAVSKDQELQRTEGGRKAPKCAIVSDSDEELMSSDEEEKKSKKKNRKNGHKVNEDHLSDSEEEKRKAELELLLADDNPEEYEKRHFNLKAIQKEEKESRKKKKWKVNLKKRNAQEEDNFKIDTSDNRFSALFTSHLYNIDPADPHFRKTKAMNELIAEKQKRRKLDS